ncbi:hypothetical protein FDK21_20355 [Cohaesibacter sp. CAU 1516]|uniref:hypothetical protein n=1 Tax=Cohaesibacter sp. CAU 1516 TaxID=2576038 RepID=UPI0010FEFF70|nr:hypothetical protein [Cohaesibacter sp. CAU 1516]TLP41905.1 hypothetical protein FDK21_20355 [Cohaesibacter sp. CAU 1516]
MAKTRFVLTMERVAEILEEDLEFLQKIVTNDDNLSYGNIVDIEDGSDNSNIALTSDGLEELQQMLIDARSSEEEWEIFLQDFIADPEIIARVKAKKLR